MMASLVLKPEFEVLTTARTMLIAARWVLTMARDVLTTARMVPTTARMVPTTARVAQKRHSELGPPSSQTALEVKHGSEQMLGGGLGAGGAAGGRGGGDGMETRRPQSPHSVPWAHVAKSEPGPPPSLHELSPALWRWLVHTMPGVWGGGGGRPSQSLSQIGNSETGPPSSHSASQKHVFVQMSVPARRGAGLTAGDGSDWPGP
jgi:hypothetical protein